MLPIRCLACEHRFQRTAIAVLEEDACPKCASSNIDVDEAGLEAKQATGDGCPECGHTLQWGRHPGEAGRFGEELGFCPYCEWKGTEDDLRVEASASSDLSFEQDPVEASFINAWIDGVCIARIDTRSFDVRWIDGMEGRGPKTKAAAVAAIKERLDKPSYRRLLTEAPAGTAWPKLALAKVSAMANSIRDSNPGVPYEAAVELAREAVRRFPSVVSS